MKNKRMPQRLEAHAAEVAIASRTSDLGTWGPKAKPRFPFVLCLFDIFVSPPPAPTGWTELGRGGRRAGGSKTTMNSFKRIQNNETGMKKETDI